MLVYFLLENIVRNIIVGVCCMLALGACALRAIRRIVRGLNVHVRLAREIVRGITIGVFCSVRVSEPME